MKKLSMRFRLSRFPCCVLLALSWNTNENPSTDKLSRAINLGRLTMKYINLSDALAGTAAIVDFGRLTETRRRRERSLLTNLVNSPRPLSAPPSNEETSIFSCQLLTSQVF